MDGNESEHDVDVDDDRIVLLPHEEELILSTMNDDVLIVTARGLGLERLVLNHLHLYCDSKLLVLVINASSADEHFYLTRLKMMNPKCPPKLLNSDVLAKQRETIYLEGGVQFITSRVLMVDFLTDRVPAQNVAGIVILRAHELLKSFQESFILRLYREKKADGFVKAFTDNPTAITSAGFGQLQRLFDKLYVKSVRLLPRFDVNVKESFDKNPPAVTFFEVDLSPDLRKTRVLLMDIIRTCVRELKNTSKGLNVELEDDALNPTAALYPTKLELDMRAKTLLLTERQAKILQDLQLLRSLLRKLEDLDPYTAHCFVKKMTSDKDYMENNSGWLSTPSAFRVFSLIENMCHFQAKDNDVPVIAVPPKWETLKMVLSEIESSRPADGDTVLLIAPTEDCCRQLIDVIKFGIPKFQYLLSKMLAESTRLSEPRSKSMWNPNCLALYSVQSDLKTERQKVVNKIQKHQKQATTKRKRLEPDPDTPGAKRQSSLMAFTVSRDKKKTAEEDAGSVPDKESSKNGDSDVIEIGVGPPKDSGVFPCNAMLVLLSNVDRYTLIKALEDLKPAHVILYHTDVAFVRILDTYNALNLDKNLKIYNILYKSSAEEERYMLAIERESVAFEKLIKEQGTLLVPSNYDVNRESTTKLRRFCQKTDSRRAVAAVADEENSKVIVDMREFNAELPTVLYKNGVDLAAATLEVGDYILSPTVCVERKALDDLTQSLNSGRVFKQIEQMLRHYNQSILLIESSEKFKLKKVNGGPFQGELSKRSRDTRSLLTMLIRMYPKMSILWAGTPRISCNYFEEIKLNQPNPCVDTAIGIKSTDVGGEKDDDENDGDVPSTSTAKSGGKSQVNPVMKRQMNNLFGLGPGDVDKLLNAAAFQTPQDVFKSTAEELKDSGLSEQQAGSFYEFITTDFRYRMD